MFKFCTGLGFSLILQLGSMENGTCSSIGESMEKVADTLLFFFFLGGATGNWGGCITKSVSEDSFDIATIDCSLLPNLECLRLFAFVLAITSGSCNVTEMRH